MPRFATRFLSLALLMAVSATAQQFDPTTNAIIEEGTQRNQSMRHLYHLTNRIGPRLTSSSALMKAQEWAVRQLQSWGYDARLEEWGEFAVGFDRGLILGRMVSPEAMSFELTTPSWTHGTKGLARGDAVIAPGRAGEYAAAAASWKGKWVVMPDVRRRRSAGSGMKALINAAEEAGALGVISGTSNELVHTSGNQRVDPSKLPKIPDVILRNDHWKAIVKNVEAEKEVVLEFDIENRFVEGPIKLYNVVADLVGSEFPNEYVCFGGHIDSWDGAQGTTDNGTGASTTLEAARILGTVGAKPRRTIRFFLWSGEEQGLLGSAAWVRSNRDVMKSISSIMVHDGGTNYLSGISGIPSMMADFEKVFAPCKTLNPDMPFTINETSGIRGGGGSDHSSYIRAGVPGFFWNQRGGKAVYRHTWHTQNDTFDAGIPEYQRHSSTIIALAGWGLANLDHLLSRDGMTPRRLGVVLAQDMTISEIIDDGVAKKAGLRTGDKLMSVGGKKVDDRRQLRRILSRSGGKKEIVVMRDGKEVKVVANWGRK